MREATAGLWHLPKSVPYMNLLTYLLTYRRSLSCDTLYGLDNVCTFFLRCNEYFVEKKWSWGWKLILSTRWFTVERDDDEHNELTAHIGDDVWLNCSCSSTIGTDVDWRYQRHPGQFSKPVYQSGYYQVGFEQRFTAIRHSRMEYSLVINNITLNDSGVYLCIEEKGQGRTHYYALNVTTGILFVLYFTKNFI